MRDLKSPKAGKIRGNKRNKPKKQPRDWKGLFRKALRVTVCLVTLALGMGGGGLLVKVTLDSNLFRIDTVQIEGPQRVSKDELLALADIGLGTSIFDLDLDMVGRKIEENPWVLTADVQRIFPRAVMVKVTEREPRALINLDYLYYVDDHGDIFKVLEKNDSLDYPVITGISRAFLLEHPDKTQSRLAGVARFIDRLSDRREFTLEDVSEVHIGESEGIILYTASGGVPIRMGDDGFEDKLNRLERIYGELKPRLPVLRYIDLQVMDRVIVKLEAAVARG